jgi:hypothetical protein
LIRSASFGRLHPAHDGLHVGRDVDGDAVAVWKRAR